VRSRRAGVSRDKRTYRFHLRRNAKSNFGNTLSAEDVVWSAQKWFGTKFIAAIIASLLGLKGPQDFTAVNESTVQVKVPGTLVPYFLDGFAITWMAIYDSTEARKHVTAKDKFASSWLLKNTAGYGPFKIAQWQEGQRMVLEPNPGYWSNRSMPARIVHEGVPETSQRLQLLLAGSADVAEELMPTQLERVASDPKLKVTQMVTTKCSFIPMNNSVAPFDDPRIRQGIAYAIPYDDIVRSVYRGYARRWRAHMPDWFAGAGNTKAFWPYETNTQKAAELLAPIKGRSLTFAYAEGTSAGEQVSVLVQKGLNAAGLDVTLQKLPRSTYDAKKLQGQLPFFLDEFDAPIFVQSVYGFQIFFTSHPSAGDLMHYQNAKKIDAVVARLLAAKTQAAQDLITRQGLRILAEDMPFVPIAMTPTNVAHTREVTGVRPRGGESLPYYPAFRLV
jgi:peptide/nickel transport system substrate-binding protein